MLKRNLITTINAQTSTNAFPTIPYIPPGGTPTPTSTVTNTPAQSLGSIILSSDKTSYSIGEFGIVKVIINSNNQDLDVIKVVLEFDPDHIEIVDANSSIQGTQVDYKDTFFLATENLVETNINGSASGLRGRITISAQGQNNQAATISNRTIAEIGIRIKASKTSNILISKQQSALLLTNIDKLDENSLVDLSITSGGGSAVPSIVLGPGDGLVKTALDSPESVLIVLFSIISIFIGVTISRQVKQRKNAPDL